jgi:hypothetical protein
MPPAKPLLFIDDTPAKECSRCGEIKPLYEFHNSGIHARYKRPDCKVCVNKTNKECYNKYKGKSLARLRDNRLKKYGINQEQYDELYSKQEGKCAICNIKHEVLSVDHCHIKNKIRGLLCNHCNFGVGHFKNDVQLLIKAISYLVKS